MTHAPDRQLNAQPVGWFGRLTGRIFDTAFVLAIPVTIALFVWYFVQFE